MFCSIYEFLYYLQNDLILNLHFNPWFSFLLPFFTTTVTPNHHRHHRVIPIPLCLVSSHCQPQPSKHDPFCKKRNYHATIKVVELHWSCKTHTSCLEIVRRWVAGLWKLEELWTRWEHQSCSNSVVESWNLISTTTGGVLARTLMLKLESAGDMSVGGVYAYMILEVSLPTNRQKWVRVGTVKLHDLGRPSQDSQWFHAC